MKIAFFSDNFYPELSGIADSIMTTAIELGKQGHQVRFYVPRYATYDYGSSQPVEPELPPSVSVYRIPSFHVPTGTGQGRFVYSFLKPLRDVEQFNPDILHVHLPFSTGIIGLLAHMRLKKPFVGTNHTLIREFMPHLPILGDSLKQLSSRYAAWFYNHCSFISTPSESILREMEQSGFCRPGKAISNPIPETIFYELPKKKELKKKHHLPDFTILYVGRLSEEKNPHVILRAFARVSKKIPGAGIVFVGKGPMEEALRKEAARLQIASQVIFFGFVRDKVILNEIYNASDLFVIMSTSETQGMVALQAMIVGTPAVAARSWGLAEYVKEEFGFPVPPGDDRALSEVFLDLFTHPRKASQFGKKGKQFASQFTPGEIAKLWLTRYNQEIKNV